MGQREIALQRLPPNPWHDLRFIVRPANYRGWKLHGYLELLSTSYSAIQYSYVHSKISDLLCIRNCITRCNYRASCPVKEDFEQQISICFGAALKIGSWHAYKEICSTRSSSRMSDKAATSIGAQFELIQYCTPVCMPVVQEGQPPERKARFWLTSSFIWDSLPYIFDWNQYNISCCGRVFCQHTVDTEWKICRVKSTTVSKFLFADYLLWISVSFAIELFWTIGAHFTIHPSKLILSDSVQARKTVSGTLQSYLRVLSINNSSSANHIQILVRLWLAVMEIWNKRNWQVGVYLSNTHLQFVSLFHRSTQGVFALGEVNQDERKGMFGGNDGWTCNHNGLCNMLCLKEDGSFVLLKIFICNAVAIVPLFVLLH